MISLRATKKFSAFELPRACSPITSLEKMCAELDVTGMRAVSCGENTAIRKFATLTISSPTASPIERPSKMLKTKAFDPAKKGVPNYFIGIRLNCPIFQQKIESIQDEVKAKSPRLSRCMTSSRKLHITSFVLELRSPMDIEQAIYSFESCASSIKALIDGVSDKVLQFDSLNRFGSSVLFAAPVMDDNLLCLKDISTLVGKSFNEIGLLSSDQVRKLSSWKPHVTIAKTSADRSKAGRMLKILTSDYESCSCANIFSKESPAIVPFTTIDLLSMQEVDDDGYYRKLASISLV